MTKCTLFTFFLSRKKSRRFFGLIENIGITVHGTMCLFNMFFNFFLMSFLSDTITPEEGEHLGVEVVAGLPGHLPRLINLCMV